MFILIEDNEDNQTGESQTEESNLIHSSEKYSAPLEPAVDCLTNDNVVIVNDLYADNLGIFPYFQSENPHYKSEKFVENSNQVRNLVVSL